MPTQKPASKPSQVNSSPQPVFLYACLPHASKERGVFRRLVASIIQVATTNNTPTIYISSAETNEAIGQAIQKDTTLNPTLLEALCFSHDTSPIPNARITAVHLKGLKQSPRDFESEIAYNLIKKRCSRAIFIGGYSNNRFGRMDLYYKGIFATHANAHILLVTSLGGSVVQLQDNEEYRKQCQIFSSNDYPRFRLLLERYIFAC